MFVLSLLRPNLLPKHARRVFCFFVVFIFVFSRDVPFSKTDPSCHQAFWIHWDSAKSQLIWNALPGPCMLDRSIVRHSPLAATARKAWATAEALGNALYDNPIHVKPLVWMLPQVGVLSTLWNFESKNHDSRGNTAGPRRRPLDAVGKPSTWLPTGRVVEHFS